ncbi:MAG: BrnT family toxin [Candidatus Riflebacteria bacterium]|nr:BrnT family toxin [Candidatus Riflebacteria bacterium]
MLLTTHGRPLFVSFVIRNLKIRVISARDMTSREFQEFAKYEKENT